MKNGIRYASGYRRFLKILRGLRGQLQAQSKRRDRAREKLVLWVIACNRAGKTTVLNILRKCPESFIYDEGSTAAYQAYRIRSPVDISRLIAATDKRLVIFELANDLQYADRFLNLGLHSRALWIFRNYEDVARDSVRKWGPAQRDMMSGIGAGLVRHPGQQAIAEQMAPATLSLVKSFNGVELSPEEGAALLWYTRNVLYFQLGLEQDPRVLPVKYEDLVARPREVTGRLFDFIACAFKAEYAQGIDASHIGKTPLPGLRPEIRALCDRLMRRFDERYALDSGARTTVAGADPGVALY